MSRDWAALWLDNPIFVKHFRSRLRGPSLATALVITLSLCFCIAWGGFELDAYRTGGAFGAFYALGAVILGILGASQVNNSVFSARASGIMDFHRVSPLSPTELALGFFFGAPVREYILLACTLPFLFLCVAMGTPDFRGLVQLLIVLLSTSWVLHGLALVTALIFRRPAGPRGARGIVVFLGLVAGNSLTGLGRLANIVDREPRIDFFGVSLPWLALLLLYQTPFLLFFFLIARRKMDSERLHPLSKPQAALAMASLSVLLTGAIWNQSQHKDLAVGLLYVLVILGIMLSALVTPSQAEYVKGLRRARKLGWPRLSPWHDLALNRIVLLVIGSIVLVTATLAWKHVEGAGDGASGPIYSPSSLGIANGVLVVVYFGLAAQFFLLRFGRRGSGYFVLFLFLAWVVPLILGVITLVGQPGNSGPSQFLFALSPVVGLSLGSGVWMGVGNSLLGVEAAAITPSLLFTFVFNSLLEGAQRRVQRTVLATAARPNPPPEIRGQAEAAS
ncbi:MAG: hypothetical protein ACLP7Q_11450 [Isosphaeraceae bacterium]